VLRAHGGGGLCLQDADDQAAALASVPKKPKIEQDATFLPSALDPATQRLISLIFNEDMFNEAMQVNVPM
jgi:hypothetical protein